MGLIDKLTSDPDPDDDDSEGPDCYRVVRMVSNDGWEPVSGYDDLDQPIDEQTFRYNEEPLEPGKYRLFAVDNNLNVQPPDGEGWAITVEDDTADEPDPEDERFRRLEQRLEQIAQDDQTGNDPQELVEQQKASITLQLLQSPEFLRQHGDKIALSMFDLDGLPMGGGGGGDGLPAYDQFSESPTSAALYSIFNTAMEDPGQFEQITESLGRGAGQAMSGALQGMGDDQAPALGQPDADQTTEQPTDDRDDQESTADPDPEPEPREIDAGPSDPSDLMPSDPETPDEDELVETVAAAERAKREATADPAPDPDSDDPNTETVRREGPGTTSGTGADPMTAGPRHEPEGDPDPDRETTTTAAPDPDHAENGHDEDISDVQTPADAREQLQSETADTEPDDDADDTATVDDRPAQDPADVAAKLGGN